MSDSQVAGSVRGGVGVLGNQAAVLVDGPVVVIKSGGADSLVQSLLGDLDSPGLLGGVGILADLAGLIGPDVGGTVEIVAALVLFQVAVVQLLAQFHDGALSRAGGGGGLQIADGAGISLVAGDIIVGDLAGLYDHTVGVDLDGVVVSLDHAGLQSVQNQLSQVVAGHGLGNAGVHIFKQLDLASLLDGGELPVVLEVGLILEVAQGLHQHQSGLGGSDGVAAAEGLGVVAGDDAVGVAGGHIGFSPGGHISEGAGALVVGYAVVQQVGHDHGHLVAGDLSVGVEVAVLVAGHDADFLENFDGFLILLGRHIGVARAGADYHQAHDHDGSQSQAKSPFQVSHSGFLLKFFRGLF